MTFYEKILKLCQNKGISITKMATDIGFSSAASRNWKDMTVPRSSTAKKIADYFGIDVSYFFEGDTPTPAPSQEPAQIAFSGGMDDLTPEEFDKVYEYIKYLKSQRKN